jgi:hypothetical protein
MSFWGVSPKEYGRNWQESDYNPALKKPDQPIQTETMQPKNYALACTIFMTALAGCATSPQSGAPAASDKTLAVASRPAAPAPAGQSGSALRPNEAREAKERCAQAYPKQKGNFVKLTNCLIEASNDLMKKVGKMPGEEHLPAFYAEIRKLAERADQGEITPQQFDVMNDKAKADLAARMGQRTVTYQVNPAPR